MCVSEREGAKKVRHTGTVTVELDTKSQGDAITEVEHRLKNGWKLVSTMENYDKADMCLIEAHVKVKRTP